MLRVFTLAMLVSISRPALAQDVDSTLVGNCLPPQAETILQGGNLLASIANNGSLFYPGQYEIPKGSGISALFNVNLWLGGLIDEDLREAGSRYGPFEYWAGTLPADRLPPSSCSRFDKIFEVDAERDLLRTGPSLPSENLLRWPVDMGAPYIDVDGIEGYDPNSGDRPAMYGDQMHWWVMNDRGNVHLRTRSDPLGVEVRATAYSYDRRDVAGNTVFVRYEITNRNDQTIEDMFFGQRIDQDVHGELHSATDTTLGMVYSYYMEWDESLFGDAPPAVGVTLLSASHEPKPEYERYTSIPETGFTHSMIVWLWLQEELDRHGDLYDWLRGLWPGFVGAIEQKQMEGMLGGAEERVGGLEPRLVDPQPTDFMYPGDPVTATYWSMNNYNGGGADLHPQTNFVIGSYGPFDLNPDETFTTTVAVVWSRGNSNLGSVGRLRTDVAYLKERAAHLTSPRFVEPPPDEPERGLQVEVYPNPAGDWLSVRIRVPVAVDATIQLFDVLGRRVQTLFSEPIQPGEMTHEVDVSELRPGLYVARIQFGRAVGYRSVNIY